MIFLCYERCSTCRKAKKWLEENSIPFQERPIREQNPTADELLAWQRKSSLPLRKFFNTSGMLYREMKLSEKLPGMTEENMLSLLAADGMLVKRPLLVSDQAVIPGFREKDWEAVL